MTPSRWGVRKRARLHARDRMFAYVEYLGQLLDAHGIVFLELSEFPSEAAMAPNCGSRPQSQSDTFPENVLDTSKRVSWLLVFWSPWWLR